MAGLLKHRALTAAILALLLTALFVSKSQAHASLLRSDPADGAILGEAPREVRLWFDEPISIRFSSAQLFDVNSRPVPIDGIRGDASDPTLLIITLPELPEGTYTILWKILSESDGHLNQGMLVYGIGQGDGSEMGSVVAPEAGAPPLVEVILRWLNFTLLAGMVGAAAMARLVLAPTARHGPADPTTGPILAAARRRVITLAIVCTGLGLLIGLGLLLWQGYALRQTLPEGTSFLSVGRQVLTQTRLGTLWLARQISLLITGGLLLVILQPAAGRPPRRVTFSEQKLWLAADFFLLALLAIQSLGSHAAGLRVNVIPALVADVLHLLAASLWVGGLLALAVALLPLVRRHQAEASALIRAGWKPFGWVAVLSVGLLAATGLYSAGQQVATPDALLSTLYGQALIGKIGLVLVTGAFGLLNSMLLHPRLASPLARPLRRPAGWTPIPLKRFPLLVVAEVTLGLAILLVTGLVTASEAPRGSEFSLASGDIPNSLSQKVDDVVITLSAKPNRPGQNVLTVFASSTRRPTPAGIARVIVRFTYLDQESGRLSADAEELEPGRYLLGGSQLSLAGNWQVDVVVRRLGLEDSVAHFDWIVAPPGETRPVIVSNTPLEPILTLAAAGLILLMPLVTALVWVKLRRIALIRNVPKGQDVINAELLP